MCTSLVGFENGHKKSCSHFVHVETVSKLLIKWYLAVQWCSRDCNIRDLNLVKISRPRLRSRLHQKLRDRYSRHDVRDRDKHSRLQNFCILPKFFWQRRYHFWVEFFFYFWHFSDVFCLFLTWKYNQKKSLNYRNFDKPFICNIRSLETWNLRDRDRDEDWNLQDRDRDLVSRLHHCLAHWLFLEQDVTCW